MDYDKDNDDHLDFITAFSNLRARNFSIQEKDRCNIVNFLPITVNRRDLENFWPCGCW